MFGSAFLKPKIVLESWDVRPGEKIADFGCGAGFFSVALAQCAGPQGTVYALDVRQEALDAARAKIKIAGATTVQLIRADLEQPNGSGIKGASVDKVLIANILFQAENKQAVLQEVARILRPQGSLLVIEWDPEKSAGAPVLPNTINRIEARKCVENAGFEQIKEISA